MTNQSSIEVHTDDADLSDPGTTYAAWYEGGIICDDSWVDSKCDGTREHALQHAAAYAEDCPQFAAGVYVYAFTPTAS